MDKKIQKLLDNKYENLVQFNVTNTTSNSIFLDLFNTSDLSVVPNVPTYIYPPNSVQSTFGSTSSQFSAIASNGFLYTDDASTNILVYDTNNNNTLITTISLFGFIVGTGYITYNSINNRIYVSDIATPKIIVINCSSNTINSTIFISATAITSTFNFINNSLYLTSVSSIIVVDIFTNSEITSIPIASTYISFNSTNNLIYTSDSTSNNVSIIDCNTNTFVGIIALNNPAYIQYCPNNNFLYIANNGGVEIAIINASNNLLVNTLTIPLGIGILTFSVYDNVENNIYWGTTLGYNLVISCTNNLIIDNFFVGSSVITTGVYNALQNSVYFSLPFLSLMYQITTIGVTTTPYYISGSANYNAFVNNLNNEPIEIQMIRLLVLNQDQLYNQLQLTTIDSNGNQIFLPDFPINKIDINQEQGNISEIELKDVVFDGRTYINQYQLNPFESLSFEIYYIQLDLTTATPTYPIFFKPKIQLKEYIKKELNL